MEPNATAIEHQNVPVEHQGLHSFLYASEDEHSAEATVSHGIINGATNGTHTADQVMPLEDWCTLAGDTKVAGVYAVFDRNRQLQYVNISRHVSLSLKGHQTQLGSDFCAFVRVHPVKFPKREAMAALQSAWIAENGTVPPGNQDSGLLWAETIGAAALAAMSPAEQLAYEEKKLKLRKAMADSTLSQELPPVEADPSKGDDWSNVIQAQTQDTL